MVRRGRPHRRFGAGRPHGHCQAPRSAAVRGARSGRTLARRPRRAPRSHGHFSKGNRTMKQCRLLLSAVVALAVHGGDTSAQTPEPSLASARLLPGQLVERGPRFLVASGPQHVPLDAARTPALKRRLTLDLDGVTTHDALKAI